MVVPTIPMTSSITVASCPEPPGMSGTTKPRAICGTCGCAIT